MSVTILHVDDDLELPSGFAARLVAGGYRLVQTEDPDEARRLVAAGEPDLVLFDPLLATCDGPALLEELATAEGLVVVVHTRGERTADLWGEALELGVADFVAKPATSGQLFESVEAALRGDAAREADPDADAPPGPEAEGQTPLADVARSGSLAERGMAGLLHDLRECAYSGVLIVNRGDERTGIQLRNGNPAAVSARGEREPLEAFLLRSGRITEAQHDSHADQLSAGMGSTREIFLGMDVLSEEALDQAEREQAEEPLFRVFAWSDADYHLLPGKRLKAGSAMEVSRSATSLIFEGALREAPIEEIRGELDRCVQLYLSESEHAERLATEAGLTRSMAASVEGLQGDRAVGEVASSGALDERLLYALLRTGIAVVHEEPVLLLLEAVEEPAAPSRAASQVPEESSAAPEATRAETLEGILKDLEKRDAYGVLEISEESDAAIRAAYEARVAELTGGPTPDDAKAAKRLAQLRTRLEKAYEQIQDTPSRQRYVAVRRQEEEERAAQEVAERALEAERWFRKGEASLKAKQYSEAAEAFGMAAHLDPEEGEYLAHLGWALYRTNPKEDLVRREANEHLAKGIKLTPERSLPYVYLGRMFKETGAEERARRMFQRAVHVDPKCHPALQELRLLNMRKEKGKGFLGRLRRK